MLRKIIQKVLAKGLISPKIARTIGLETGKCQGKKWFEISAKWCLQVSGRFNKHAPNVGATSKRTTV